MNEPVSPGSTSASSQNAAPPPAYSPVLPSSLPPSPWGTSGAQPMYYPVKKQSNAWVWALTLGLMGFMLLIVVISIGTIAYKTVAKNGAEATRLVNGLHEQMAAKDWDAIYASTTPGFRKVTPPDKHLALFSGIDRKLGAPMSTERLTVNINTTTTGTFLRATFRTKFARDATAVETISWKRTGTSYELSSYHINSDELMTR